MTPGILKLVTETTTVTTPATDGHNGRAPHLADPARDHAAGHVPSGADGHVTTARVGHVTPATVVTPVTTPGGDPGPGRTDTTAVTTTDTAAVATARDHGHVTTELPSAARWVDKILDGLLTVATGPLAWTGQIGFAIWAGVTDERRFLVPAIGELFALSFLLKGYLRARRNRSPLLYWAVSATFGAFAVYTNIVHAGHRGGLVYGTASAACQVLWFVAAYEEYTAYRVRTGKALGAAVKLGSLWLTAPRLALRAKLVSLRLQIVDETSRDRDARRDGESALACCLRLAGTWIKALEAAREQRLPAGKDKDGNELTRPVGTWLARRTAWEVVETRAGRRNPDDRDPVSFELARMVARVTAPPEPERERVEPRVHAGDATPPRRSQTRRPVAPVVPVSPAPTRRPTPVVEPQWWQDYAGQITDADTVYPGWLTAPAPLTVRQVQGLDGHPGIPRCGNSTTARNVTKCLQLLWQTEQERVAIGSEAGASP